MTSTSTEDAMAEARDTIARNADVVALTSDLPRPDWLKLRKKGLGGSDAAGALGLSPWVTPFSLWVDKSDESWSDEENDRMKWGRRLERTIIEGFSEDYETPVIPYPQMLRSKEWPWMLVDMDGLAPLSVVEAKNVDRFMADEWDDGAVPGHYTIQGQHACAVTGLPGVHYAALIGGNDLRAVYVPRNDSLIEKLVEAELNFWKLVEAGTPPELDGTSVTQRALKRLFADPDAMSVCNLPLEAVVLLQERARIKDEIKNVHEARVTEIENQIYAWLGDHEIGKVNGEIVVTWKKQDRKEHFVKATSFRKIHVPKGTLTMEVN